MRFGTSIAGVGEPTFILLHALASTRRIWDFVLPLLKVDHKVIAFDLRGHGETEKPEAGYGLEDLAGDIDELMRRYGVTRPVLVGHSAGANLALHHAATRRNARGIVLVDGGVIELHAHLSWDETLDALAPAPDDAYQIEKFVRDGWSEVPNNPQLMEVRRSLYEWDKSGRSAPGSRANGIWRSCVRSGSRTSMPTWRRSPAPPSSSHAVPAPGARRAGPGRKSSRLLGSDGCRTFA
jgi:pimeloyl-ACP methyl ester carboxylesterase